MRNAMKSTIILTGCALLALAGTAAAGPCTSEIDSVAKLLAAKDAGQGPTAGNTAATGQHPPTTAMSKADTSTAASTAAAKSGRPEQPPTAAMTSAATNMPTNSAAKAEKEHPPTAAMNAAAQGSAASPQDVQRQTSGQPTAAQQAQGASGHGGQTASSALEQARTFDKAGQETQCMDAVHRARELAGS
jgi:hypothetical protein